MWGSARRLTLTFTLIHLDLLSHLLLWCKLWQKWLLQQCCLWINGHWHCPVYKWMFILVSNIPLKNVYIVCSIHLSPNSEQAASLCWWNTFPTLLLNAILGLMMSHELYNTYLSKHIKSRGKHTIGKFCLTNTWCYWIAQPRLSGQVNYFQHCMISIKLLLPFLTTAFSQTHFERIFCILFYKQRLPTMLYICNT